MTKPSQCLNLSELFYSIQGESSWAGMPCLFIRLSGCNLRCQYCDAAYTWQEKGKETSLTEIASFVHRHHHVGLVEITGGEPLLQEEVYPLIDLLQAEQKTVLIESNGSIPIDRVPVSVHLILDMKCPDAHTGQSFHQDNLRILKERKAAGARDEVKFVLSSENDFFWACRMVTQEKLYDLVQVMYSPVRTLLSPQALAKLLLDNPLPVRLQLQLHTQIWPDKSRGV